MSPWMQTLLPVAAGFAVVLVGILVFKLHAFLALLLAAVVTSVLTPDDAIVQHRFESLSETVTPVDSLDDLSEFAISAITSGQVGGDEYLNPSGGAAFHAWRWYERLDAFVAVATLHAAKVGQVFTSDLDVRTPVAYFQGNQLYVATSTIPAPTYVQRPNDLFVRESRARQLAADTESIPERIAKAFGDMVGEIGILIAFAAIIGMCLLDSGAADRIVRSALNLVGRRGTPVAFAGSGFLLGIPVFFDTVFFLLIPLGKAMRLRTGRNYILYVLTIYCGATMAHSLVPPTPGPLLVAESLGIEIGVMMLVGLCVGLVTAGYGILHAWLVNRWIDIPLRDTPDMPLADLQRLAARQDHELPPLWLSLLPIVLPVWLIAQATVVEMIRHRPPPWTAWVPSWIFNEIGPVVTVLGDKNTALGIGVVLGLFLLVWQTRCSLRQVRDRVGKALATGGTIILITAAGGAFGEIIAQTGVASLIADLPTLGTLGLLTLAFAVTTTIRTVQGSATVAMITAVGLFAGITPPFHPVWLALAIGCGSKPISWMTDSGFWVICKMSGMTEAETLKTLTPMTIMMGLVGLATALVGATLFPLR